MSTRDLERLAVALAFVLVAVPVASGSSEQGSGSLALQAQLSTTGTALVPCPPEAPPEVDLCSHRTSSGGVRGVGFVTQSYWYLVDDDPVPSCSGVRPLRGSGEMAVKGRGTIEFELGRTDQCFPSSLETVQPYVITGGSGTYALARGAGAVNHDLTFQGAEPTGTDTWSGSLDVPGLEFDLAPPALNGLVDRIVRVRKGVKRVRVKYRVTARDQVEGARPASCQPGSGSRFKVGRTVVKCLSSDLSANTATGTFRVIVKRRR